ncbi:unnamed protein product [[Candida] boidinii]|uniref:Unnamed protein product n=1 Tax=Candida boidinii TaxID=5477 RepID=A0A9W6WDB9_CANBO|nr:hypothetical protein B5S30_g2460 [[Candida] boidinii]OWB85021.1 hypothetical protein B5S33_g3678 [[Candida] boidinii]GME79891.1 unnamed protein product [[Candida] boidinii]GMG08400.1 unnamed protein product [[Candida] boidinii]
MDKKSTTYTFRKLNDENDSTFTRIYKKAFRYATPNLMLWGPLAPCYDVLEVRKYMAATQMAIGLGISYGTIRKYSPRVSAFRRRMTRGLCFATGTVLIYTGLLEISYSSYKNKLRNPLYIEASVARTLAEQVNGETVSWWYGPEDYMPMNNERLFEMLQTIKLSEDIVAKYKECSLVQTYQKYMTDFAELREKELNREKSLGKKILKRIEDPETEKLKVVNKDELMSYQTAISVEPEDFQKTSTRDLWYEFHPWLVLLTICGTTYLTFSNKFIEMIPDVEDKKKEEEFVKRVDEEIAAKAPGIKFEVGKHVILKEKSEK